MLLIIWYLPFFKPPPNQPIVAWQMAASFIPISFGWAAGDVSLAAYIQASLARGGEATTAGISTLGAVMSFLYVTYVRPLVLLPCSYVDGLLFQIVTYAILSPVLGSYVDSQVRYVSRRTVSSNHPTDTQCRQLNVHHALLNVGAIHFTILSGMILIASMTPRGALRLNPQLISDEIGKDFEEVNPPEQHRLGKAPPISEKDGESSIAATEPDIKQETSFDASSIHSPATPTSPIGPFSPMSQHSHNSQVSGVFNSADDREQERSLRMQRSASRERRPKSAAAGRELQKPILETRVHMPTGNRVDLNVSTRALPLPPSSPYSQSPQTPLSQHSPHTPMVERSHSRH